MPSVHRNALKKLLESIERHIVEAEKQLLTTINDEERTALVNTLVDLQIRRRDTKAALTADEPPSNTGNN